MHLHPNPSSKCAICRHDVIEGRDKVVLLLREAGSYYGHTNSIVIAPDSLITSIEYHHNVSRAVDSMKIPGLICRKIRCPDRGSSPEATVCHTACVNLVVKWNDSKGIKKVLENISDNYIFFQAWPRSEDECYGAAEPTMKFGDLHDVTISCESDTGLYNLIHALKKVPAEIRLMIVEFSRDSELWRLWNALQNRRLFTIKDDLENDKNNSENLKENKISNCYLSEMGDWVRGNELSKKPTKPIILLVIDNQGLKEVALFDERPVHQKRLNGRWHACLEATQVKDIKVTLKGGRIHLSQRPANLELWDTPNIPEPTHLFYDDSITMSCRKRIIDLNKLHGLTFFMAHSKTYAISPHYDDGTDTALQTYHGISDNFGLRNCISWVYIPLRSSHISRLYVRTADNAHNFGEPSLVLKTYTDETYHTGFYPTIQNRDLFKYKPIGVEPSLLVYEDPLPGMNIERFGSYASLRGTPARIQPRHDAIWHNYFSVASLENVRAITTFCEEKSGYCRGLVIHYHDKHQQVLGECRNYFVQKEFNSSSYTMCWNTYHGIFADHVRVAFRQDEQEVKDLCDEGYTTATKSHLIWYFRYEEGFLCDAMY